MDAISLLTNAESYWTRVEDSKNCFEPDTSSITPVHIIDTFTPAAQPQLQTQLQPRQAKCANLQELKDYLEEQTIGSYSTRFISICQKNSWSRLQITTPMLRKLMGHHDIDCSFLEVALSFFHRMTDEEESFCVPWTSIEDKLSFQMFYTFRYAALRELPREPWVIRQAGVYQKFDSLKKTSVYILISAHPDSAAHRRVLESLSNHQAQLQSSPLWLHGVIHSSYFTNWRRYLVSYEQSLLTLANTTTATFINKPLRVNHDTLGRVRHLESRFLPLRAILKNFEEVTLGLHVLGEDLVQRNLVSGTSQRRIAMQIENSQRYCRAYIQTANFLQQRSNNTATLLADTLAFRNQVVAQEQNGSMIILTRSAVFITVITLVYLPWTLVTGIFGMEFFEMDPETQTLLTSPQIWVYVVTAVGVTALTMTLYYVMAGLPQIRMKKGDGYREAAEDHVPQSLQRGYTDIEKNPRVVSTPGS